ncbi:hypothetical protein GN244_ATG15213 [Phytophthora infestans]|uniref:Uncharacterized protein n=1 Tax=Phytophthora infestans TaxID=4787 RepID=A0A833WPD5_PHYIN|nr:hypothetical protein GN244_ATG15213 [Phytophthora infestans]
MTITLTGDPSLRPFQIQSTQRAHGLGLASGMPRRHARAPKRSNEASVCEASSSSDSDSAAEASRSSLHQRAPTRKKKRPSTHISRRRSRSGGKLPKRRKGDQKKRRSRSHSRGMSSDVSGSDAISTNDSPESSGASESDTTSGNNATVSNRGSGDGGIVTRDDLVHVSKIDVKMFDDWKTREAYLRKYSRRTHHVCVPITSWAQSETVSHYYDAYHCNLVY